MKRRTAFLPLTNRTTLAMLLKAMVVASLFVVMGSVAAAQSLSEVEVRLVRKPTGGCVGPCTNNYTITIRGDGTVQYEGSGVLEGLHTRSISPDEVVSLVNEFLRARFFNALDTYAACCSSLVRKGDTVELSGVASADDPYAAMTLRIGPRTKTVILRRDFPLELGRLPGLVDRIGGPQVWQGNPQPNAQAAKPTTGATPAPLRSPYIPPPRKTKDVPPVYPPMAAASHVQGVVIVEVTIGPDGKVLDASVLRSIPLLDQAALEAVRQWEFTPALLNGNPIPFRMTVTVKFPP
jgi:TonB family protein